MPPPTPPTTHKTDMSWQSSLLMTTSQPYYSHNPKLAYRWPHDIAPGTAAATGATGHHVMQPHSVCCMSTARGQDDYFESDGPKGMGHLEFQFLYLGPNS